MSVHTLNVVCSSQLRVGAARVVSPSVVAPASDM